MKLGSTLYIHNTIEALPFYLDAFGATLGYFEKFGDGTFMHASIVHKSSELFAISESDHPALRNLLLESTLKSSRPITCLGISFDDKTTLIHAYEVLSANGTVLLPLGKLPWSELCAEVVDQIGVYWYLSI